MTMIEKIAAAMAEATNGGKWNDGHYCDDHKALWIKRAKAAMVTMRDLSPGDLAAAVKDEDKSGAPYVVDRYIFNEHYKEMITAMLGDA